eukprot:4589492-Pleurochrysis_carterae.AAC.3
MRVAADSSRAARSSASLSCCCCCCCLRFSCRTRSSTVDADDGGGGGAPGSATGVESKPGLEVARNVVRGFGSKSTRSAGCEPGCCCCGGGCCCSGGGGGRCVVCGRMKFGTTGGLTGVTAGVAT